MSGARSSSPDGGLCRVCDICGCELNGSNRSEVLNVCSECLRGLEF